MKRAAKVAWSVGVPAFLAVLFFFFLVLPARAPSGGKLWTGGRTIASLQEEDFDRRLLRLQLCFGVKVHADQCTLERRRVCKARVVHELERALEAPGSSLRVPVEFHCEDTALGRPSVDDEDSVSLRPNSELGAIQRVLATALVPGKASSATHAKAIGTCEFLTGCKWAMKPQTFSFRRIASCFGDSDSTHRKVLLDEVGAMLFSGKGSKRRSLYPNLVEASGK